jgi:hypothetical protein
MVAPMQSQAEVAHECETIINKRKLLGELYNKFSKISGNGKMNPDKRKALLAELELELRPLENELGEPFPLNEIVLSKK